MNTRSEHTIGKQGGEPEFATAIQVQAAAYCRSIYRCMAVIAVSSVGWLGTSPAVADQLNVIEMFTSQSCYSCPAADELLADMAAADENILNLEFHVDYWNKLQYGKAGSWVDPFSSAEYTDRQRQYAAKKLRGNNGVYTPQAVINGVYGNVGSNRRKMKAGLKMESPRPVSVNVGMVKKDDESANLNISVTTESGNSEPGVDDANIYLVHYLKSASTRIPNGENHGKVMENHNIVLDMRSLGTVAEAVKGPIQTAYVGGVNQDCAVLVQSASQGAILGAARCPDTP